MKKKTYLNPVVEVMEVKANQWLMASGVNSVMGIGYGGVDELGISDPAAPEILEFGEFEEQISNSVLHIDE